MIGSLLCGIARSSPMLIVGRAVAGVGGAGITTGALTITNTIAPPQRAPVLVGYVMAFSHLGIVMGPVVGGLFSEYVTWRWCFLINLPIGAFIVLPAFIFVGIPEQAEKAAPLKVFRTLHKQLDLVGFALFTPFTIQLLLALQYGASGEHPWGSAIVIGLFCGSGVAFILWAVWTRHAGREAIIPMYILQHRVVWSAILTQCILMTAIYVVTIYLSMYFQAIQNFSPMRSGSYLLASILSQLLFTGLAAKLRELMSIPSILHDHSTDYSVHDSCQDRVGGTLCRGCWPVHCREQHCLRSSQDLVRSSRVHRVSDSEWCWKRCCHAVGKYFRNHSHGRASWLTQASFLFAANYRYQSFAGPW